MKQKALLVVLFLLVLTHSAAAKDLYKILGVEKNASQREIQKAFHRLSLKYHPDKNPSKSAQAKFAEINNAYEVLSDEEKRKNYDLFGDEQGRARGPEPNPSNGFHQSDGGGGGGSGWTNFRYTTNDNSGYRFEQHSSGFGGEGGSSGQGNTFNFPFNDPGGQEKSSFFEFSFNMNPFYNIFDSFFGAEKGKESQGQPFTSYYGGKAKSSKDSKRSQGGAQSSSSVEELNFKSFQKKVLDQLDTWAVLFVPYTSEEAQQKLQFLEQISRSLGGSIKVGYVDCKGKQQLCEQQNMWPLKKLNMRVFSLRNGKLTALDYAGEWSATEVKSLFIDVLPRLSKHLEDVDSLDDELMGMEESSPAVVLFTKKKDTPAIWRALSGGFYGRIVFFDVQVHDDIDAIAKKFQVDSFPAILGIYANGETKVLTSGASFEQVSASIEDVKAILEDFEKKSKAAGPGKKGTKEADTGVPSLTKENFGSVCSQDSPLCVIGIHKSSRGRDKLKQILKEISQKSLVRKGRSASTSKNPVSYSVLDVKKQLLFLDAFDKSLAESENLVLIAYKPKKGTYTLYDGPVTLENAENFVVEVLSGDVQLRRVVQDPVLV